MGVKLMYVFATKIYFSSLDVSEMFVSEVFSMYHECNNALFEFFFVMLNNHNLDVSFFDSFIYIKNRCFFSFYKF